MLFTSDRKTTGMKLLYVVLLFIVAAPVALTLILDNNPLRDPSER